MVPANVIMSWIRGKFGEFLISCKAEVESAPHSLDLNPSDFFLKDIYKNNPFIISTLKATISKKNQARVINNLSSCNIQ